MLLSGEKIGLKKLEGDKNRSKSKRSMILGWKMPLTQQIVEMVEIFFDWVKEGSFNSTGQANIQILLLKKWKISEDRTYYSANWMIATNTIRSIIEQLSNEGIRVPYGTVWVISMQPFFVIYATDKNYTCLNTRLLFEPLMAQVKKNNEKTAESITGFFMHSCECPKTSMVIINGAMFLWNSKVVRT